jgi:uncharacterized protein YkwD
MKALKIFLAVVLVVLVASAVFYFRNGIFFYFEKLPQAASPTIEALNDLAQRTGEVLAPEPLRVENIISGTPLTNDGIIRFTNEARAQNGGLAALTVNKKLEQAAIMKVNDMFKNQYFEHVSPSGNGPSYLADTVGYAYLMIGENLAMGNFEGDKDLVTAWMNSPGHRANILNTKYEEIGVAAAKGSMNGRTVWLAVQEFGRPVSACPSVDGSLKQKLEGYNAQINTMDGQINALLSELNSMKKGGDREGYNAKVAEYNNLINSYNLLINKSKELVAAYNAQVSAYNACVGAE